MSTKKLISIDAMVADEFPARLASLEGTLECISAALQAASDLVMAGSAAEAVRGAAREIGRMQVDLDVYAWDAVEAPEDES